MHMWLWSCDCLGRTQSHSRWLTLHLHSYPQKSYLTGPTHHMTLHIGKRCHMMWCTKRTWNIWYIQTHTLWGCHLLTFLYEEVLRTDACLSAVSEFREGRSLHYIWDYSWVEYDKRSQSTKLQTYTLNLCTATSHQCLYNKTRCEGVLEHTS